MTRALIREVASSSVFTYCNRGKATLSVAIQDISDEKIGYRRDRLKEDGSFKKNLRATEGRREIAVEVSLIKNEEIVWGPQIVHAFVDYDYVDGDALEDLSFLGRGGTRDTVLRFSLGQLEENFSARDASLVPLYQRLSEKIVDVLSTECEGL